MAEKKNGNGRGMGKGCMAKRDKRGKTEGQKAKEREEV